MIKLKNIQWWHWLLISTVVSFLGHWLYSSVTQKASATNLIVVKQSRLQAYLRPGTWISAIRKPHQGKKRVWEFLPENKDMLEKILTETLDLVNYQVQAVKQTKKGYEIEGWYLTPKWGWLDIITLKVDTQPSDSANLRVEASSVSTGLFPLSILFAPVLNCLFFFIPFLDYGLNDRCLDKVEKELSSRVDSFPA